MGKIGGLKDLVVIFAVIIGACVLIVGLGVLALILIFVFILGLFWDILKRA